MKYLIIIALFLIGCATPTRVVQDVQPLAAPDNMMYVIDEGRSVFLPVPSVLEENDVLLNADTTYIATKADVDGVEAGSFYNNDGTFTGTRIATIPAGDTLVFADQSRNRLSIVDGGSVVWGASWNSRALTDLTFFPTGSGDFLITRGDATTTRFEVDPDGVVTLHDTTGTAILTGRADGEVIVGANFDNGSYDFQVSFATSYFGDSVTMADLLQVNGNAAFGNIVEITDTLTINPGSSDLNIYPNGTVIEVSPAGDTGTELIFQRADGTDRIRIDWDQEVAIAEPGGNEMFNINGTFTTLYRDDGNDAFYIQHSDGDAVFAYKGMFGGGTDNGAYALQTNDGFYHASGDLYFAGSGVVLEGSGTQNITAGGGITHTGPYYEIQGSGGAVDITAVPQIAAGTDGEILVLRGLSDTNTVQIDDGNGVITAGAASFVMGLDDVLVLIYGGGEWVEISRSDN